MDVWVGFRRRGHSREAVFVHGPRRVISVVMGLLAGELVDGD